MIEALERVEARGLTIATRPGTSDRMMVDGILLDDEYRLAGRQLTGWAIDVGAHIGIAAARLLLENPDLSVLAIEPVPDNAELARTNLACFAERAVVLEAAVGAEHGSRTVVWHSYRQVAGYDDAYVSTNRYIGALWREDPGQGVATDAEVVSLGGLLEQFGLADISLVKIDCEGAEYGFFADQAANGRVDVIVGEYHDDPGRGSRITRLLAATHEVTLRSGAQITGLFEAVRR